MKKRLLSLALAFVMLCSLLPVTAAAKGADEIRSSHVLVEGEVLNRPFLGFSDYVERQEMFLNELDDETLECVDVDVENCNRLLFDKSGKLLSEKTLTMELPVWGGCYFGADYNFLLFGQNNPEERDDVEVFRFVRYTKDWERIDHCSVFATDTQTPFEAGSVDFAERDGKLYVHTCHKMYKVVENNGCLSFCDGKNHQSNLTLVLDMANMTVERDRTGYVSHSFAQYVRTNGKTIYTVDLGDAYPRAVCINGKNLLHIKGKLGDNATGVMLGGFELSAENCLVLGSSVDQNDEYPVFPLKQRNMFMAVADQGLQNHKIVWLTDYDYDHEYQLWDSHLVKISEDVFLAMWDCLGFSLEEYLFTEMCLVNGEGEKLGPVVQVDCALSNCRPIVTKDGKVVWYTDGLLYSLDWKELRDHPERVQSALAHAYEAAVTEPTCTEGGYTTYTCACGAEYVGDRTPSKGHTIVSDLPVEATCTETGLTVGEHCSVCNAVITKRETVPVKAHSYSAGKCTVCGGADPDYVAPTPTPAPVTNPFVDVKDTDWYSDAVLWAVQNNITGGTSATTFSPNNSCTRAQVVTFLWAANGKPEPAAKENPFKDVKESDWYYKAVMWAVQNNVTGGTSANTFSPDNPCTRAQVVTFLYAAQGKPAVQATINEFNDVPGNAWYLMPVLWAQQNEVTGGVAPGMFGPDQTCTRAQIALFLYKAIGDK